MTTELKMLAWSIFLGLAYILIAATLGTQQRGLKWNAGNRDGEEKPLTGVAARASRASRNFLETFPFFRGGGTGGRHDGPFQPTYGLRRAVVFLGPGRIPADLYGRDSLCTHGGLGGFFLGTATGSRRALLIWGAIAP